jgi:5-formyltetrahydrofolate cyclo-ligase
MPDPVDTHPLCESTKTVARSRILSARRSVAAQIRAAADAALRAALAAEVRAVVENRATAPGGSPRPVVVAGYVPMPGEPGGDGLPAALAEAAAPGYLLLPVLDADNDLDWVRYDDQDGLRPAGRGLREPAGHRLGPACHRLGPAAIAMADLIVVPAVAVDRDGVRLGRGGGSYDRALARVDVGVTIIVPLYAGELVDRLPAEPHDRNVTSVMLADGRSVRAVPTPPR